jgi:hypothetical protein
VAGPDDAPKLFGVDVQYLAGRIVLITNHWLDELKVTEPAQARAGQYTAGGGLTRSSAAGNARLQHPPMVQLHHQKGHSGIDGSGRKPGREDASARFKNGFFAGFLRRFLSKDLHHEQDRPFLRRGGEWARSVKQLGSWVLAVRAAGFSRLRSWAIRPEKHSVLVACSWLVAWRRARALPAR